MVEVKEHGLIVAISGVQAILEGRKTQTRRVIKFRTPPNPKSSIGHGGIYSIADIHYEASHLEKPNLPCPYGQVGDRLWVKETWCVDKVYDHLKPSEIPNHNTTRRYFIGDPLLRYGHGGRWRSPRFMPRWASRITLEITGVRVERLQEISQVDIEREGIIRPSKLTEKEFWDAVDAQAIIAGIATEPTKKFCAHIQVNKLAFGRLWNSLNAKNSWETNCWVWVIEFRRLDE